MAAINLTVAAYLIVAGIAPSVVGDLSDQTGRQPVSLLTITLYFAANLGLALQNSYAGLIGLRCLQSTGSSSTIAIAHRVISDITTPAERGSYVGVLFGFTNATPSLGPIIHSRRDHTETFLALDFLAVDYSLRMPTSMPLDLLPGNFTEAGR